MPKQPKVQPKTLTLYDAKGDRVDVPEDHPQIEEYRKKWPLAEPPAEPKPEPKPAKKG